MKSINFLAILRKEWMKSNLLEVSRCHLRLKGITLLPDYAFMNRFISERNQKQTERVCDFSELSKNISFTTQLKSNRLFAFFLSVCFFFYVWPVEHVEEQHLFVSHSSTCKANKYWNSSVLGWINSRKKRKTLKNFPNFCRKTKLFVYLIIK